MRTMSPLVGALASLASLAAAAILPQEPMAATHGQGHGHYAAADFPTVHQSAILARRMLRLEGSGTLSTVFPAHARLHDAPRTREQRPEEVAHAPFALPEYIADCEPGSGNPTILQVDIATTFKNARAGSNVTLSIGWHPPGKDESEYSAAKMPRYALVGWLEEMSLDHQQAAQLQACYVKKHPDTFWTPGSDIHASRWVRFVVEYFYWFGGFGDRARIQWIGLDEWRSVTEEEIESARLPGEKGGDKL